MSHPLGPVGIGEQTALRAVGHEPPHVGLDAPGGTGLGIDERQRPAQVVRRAATRPAVPKRPSPDRPSPDRLYLASATTRSRRSQPRTVPGGTPRSRATRRDPAPAAKDRHASPTTATESRRRTSISAGRTTWVTPQWPQRTRRGRKRRSPAPPIAQHPPAGLAPPVQRTGAFRAAGVAHRYQILHRLAGTKHHRHDIQIAQRSEAPGPSPTSSVWYGPSVPLVPTQAFPLVPPRCHRPALLLQRGSATPPDERRTVSR